MQTWAEKVDATAKKYELAAMLGAGVRSDAVACEQMGKILRGMARAADRSGGMVFHLFGFRITVKRDG